MVWDVQCPACDGEVELLGALGDLEWYRCRDCGAESSVRVTRTVETTERKTESGQEPEGTISTGGEDA